MRAVPLAQRLRDLRESWGLRQKDLAATFDVSAQLVSSWENSRSPQTPPAERLHDYARFFATRRSLEGPTLLAIEALTPEEREAFEELVAELEGLRDGSTARHRTTATWSRTPSSHGFWTFADRRPVVVIGSRQPRRLLAAVPEADERHPDHVHALLHADADAVFELVAQLRLANPEASVTALLPHEIDPGRDLTNHVVIVGGPTLNPYADWFVEESAAQPVAPPVEEPTVDIQGVTDEAKPSPLSRHSFPSADESYELEEPDLKWTARRFLVPADLAAEAPAVAFETSEDGRRLAVYHPEFRGRVALGSGGGQGTAGRVRVPNLYRDLAIIARQPNRFSPETTATLIYGLFAQGTLGAARTFGDFEVGQDNESYVAERFAGADRFWMLVRVLCDRRLPLTTAPRLRDEDNRVLEWPASAA